MRKEKEVVTFEGGGGKGPAYRSPEKSPDIKFEVTPTILHAPLKHAIVPKKYCLFEKLIILN